MKKIKKIQGALITSVLLIVCLTGLDQWTKWAIMTNLDLGEKIELIHRFFYLTYVQNTGASFSMFEGAGIGFFAVITLAALGFIVWYFLHTHDFRVQLCLALIFAGALGNFIDRLRFGFVRDFFLVYIFGWPFPVFNVADICISVGFVLLLITYLYDEIKEKRHGNQTV